MNESNIHRIPVAPVKGGKTVKPVTAVEHGRALKAVAAVVVGLALAGAGIFVFARRPSTAVVRPSDVAKKMTVDSIASPPAGLTGERALSLAEDRLKDGARSGASLADAWRLAAWAAALGAPAEQVGGLRARIDAELEARWRRGRFAYLHARKLRRAVAADAALRTLRETFPHEHPYGREIDRMENRQ